MNQRLLMALSTARKAPIRLVIVFACTFAINTKPTVAQPADLSTQKISADVSVESLFVDFMHYARLGRFSIADTYAKALLSHPDLDPVQVLDVASRDKESLNTLILIVENSTIGENAAKVLKLIEKGEELRRKDPERIRTNIDLLGGNPQQEFFAIKNLVKSGEHAIAPMIQTLLDASQRQLWPRVIHALTKLGKPAVRPLTMALNMQDNDVRLHVINALGEIGYPQAVPYLTKIANDESIQETSRDGARRAIDRIAAISGRPTSGSLAQQFFDLAQRYYSDDDAVAADQTLDTANVWYWDTSVQSLRAISVPTAIFSPVMTLRCCEEALLVRNNHAPSIALWLAANVRRESRLDLDIESGDPDESGETDATRPKVFPRALYFSQSAGPRYVHMMLDRAVKDNDTPVALAAIEALRITAGATSLVGGEDLRQPLVLAMRFPDLVVRIKAALALATALPRSPFADHQFVVPILAQALTLTGNDQLLVVDGNDGQLSQVHAAIRAGNRTVIAAKNFFEGLQRVRTELTALTAIVVSTNISGPDVASALTQLRRQFMYSKTPVVLLVESSHELLAEDIASADPNVELVDARADDAAIEAAIQRVRARSGQAPLDTFDSLDLALSAVDALYTLAVDGRTVYEFTDAEPALIATLDAADEELQIKASTVLALAPTTTSQQSIASLALDSGRSESLRVAVFGSLAESAKHNGLQLSEDEVAELVRVARDDQNLVIRTAASKALGALNLATNHASDIIRSFHRG